jgi:hypothetical protein
MNHCSVRCEFVKWRVINLFEILYETYESCFAALLWFWNWIILNKWFCGWVQIYYYGLSAWTILNRYWIFLFQETINTNVRLNLQLEFRWTSKCTISTANFNTRYIVFIHLFVPFLKEELERMRGIISAYDSFYTGSSISLRQNFSTVNPSSFHRKDFILYR